MKKTYYLLIIFSFITLFSLPLITKAIGQITEPILIDNALRGKEYTEVLTLFNSLTVEATFELSADNQIANWSSFYEITDKELAKPITEIKVPANANIEATVKFTIPPDTANGEYKGEILIMYTPAIASSTSETSMSLTQTIGREVIIKVSDQEIINFTPAVIPNKYDLNPNEPLTIRIIYDNQSNISINPQIEVKVKNAVQTVYNAIFPYPENEPGVKPLTQAEIPALTIPTSGFANGRYEAQFKFLQNSQEAASQSFTFSIGMKNLVTTSKFTDLIKNYLNYLPWLIVIILLIVAAILIKRNIDTRRDLKKKFKIIKKKINKARKFVWGGITNVF